MKKRGWVLWLAGVAVVACSGSMAGNGQGVDASEGGGAGAGASESGAKGDVTPAAGGADGGAGAGAPSSAVAGGGEGGVGPVGSSGAAGGGGDGGSAGETAGDCSVPGECGCAGLAGDVTLTDVWAYQSVEIPIMTNGVEVAPNARTAAIVAGKDLMLRLFPRRTVSGDRLLSGRVLVQNGASTDTYFEKKSLRSTSPSPRYLDTTFQVAIPASKVTATTRFIAEVVDCGQPVAWPSSARYSGADGSGAVLGAVDVPALKVRIVPLEVDGLLPDTGADALEVYRSNAAAMWPFVQIDLSVGSAVTVPDARDWSTMLDKVRAQREADAPANDVYYYGIVKPTATRVAYCLGQSSCTIGLGFFVSDATSSQAPLRASVGLGFADRESAETMLHELGHNHGRQHAPCGVTDTASLDPAFPTYNGAIGGRGWDSRKGALVHSATSDLMGYCAPKWVGSYTYGGVLARALALSGAASAFELGSTASNWRVLLSDARGLRWGTPFTRPSLPYGQPERATIRDAFGRELETVVVYRSPIPDVNGASLLVPEPRPGWHSVKLAGAGALPFAP